jgi:hypothetical protein
MFTCEKPAPAVGLAQPHSDASHVSYQGTAGHGAGLGVIRFWRQSRRRVTRLPVAAAAVAVAVAFLIAACSPAGSSSSAHSAASSPPASASRLTITSTLAGHTSVPHRIFWQATPSVPGADVSEVDFLIDAKVYWVEHSAPYFYGGDDNYLVTSFLTAGPHTFTVKVVTTTGQTASQTVTATVPVAPAPPAALAGTWWNFQQQPSGNPPTGYWRLVVSQAGWRIYDTAGTGDMLDGVYPSPGQLVFQTGMATGHPLYGTASQPGGFDLNGWCNNDPGTPVRYHWSITAHDLSLRFEGGQPCPGFNAFMTSAWSRTR